MIDSFFKTTKNIYAVGRNYTNHARELKNIVPEEPIIFSKSISSLTTSKTLVFPANLNPIHFELEIVLRIGVRIDRDRFRSLDCVSHIGLGIDFTARELQNKLKDKGLPWHLSKNFQNSCYISRLKSEFDLQKNYDFELYLNGNLRQSGNTENMIFSSEKILQYINRFTGLQKGDLVFTGTPEGVGAIESGDQLHIKCETLKIDSELKIQFVF